MMVRRLLFGLFVVLIVGGGTVAAQEGLTDSDPEPNAVLPVPPERVIVTFNGPVRTWSLRVLDSTAEAVYGGPGDLLRPQTVAALLPALPPGSYTVTYEAELEDGSSVAGSYRFRVRPVPQDIDFRTPTDGETVTPGTIPVEVVTMGAEAPTISLSINGEPVDSFSG
ncbi:MAG: copper resistance protein CopC [Chloroflexi bacterium]|nr:copper resistance protein CopC [Chloroflexota bacterium]